MWIKRSLVPTIHAAVHNTDPFSEDLVKALLLLSYLAILDLVNAFFRIPLALSPRNCLHSPGMDSFNYSPNAFCTVPALAMEWWLRTLICYPTPLL